jgi:autotransporter passenger strand-loop-strand repeat protein
MGISSSPRTVDLAVQAFAEAVVVSSRGLRQATYSRNNNDFRISPPLPPEGRQRWRLRALHVDSLVQKYNLYYAWDDQFDGEDITLRGEDIVATPHATTVSSGNYLIVDSGSIATGTVVYSGDHLLVFGAASSTQVDAGGTEWIAPGGVDKGTTLDGGTEVVAAGGTVSGTVAFGGSGTLILNQSANFESSATLEGFNSPTKVLDPMSPATGPCPEHSSFLKAQPRSRAREAVRLPNRSGSLYRQQLNLYTRSFITTKTELASKLPAGTTHSERGDTGTDRFGYFAGLTASLRLKQSISCRSLRKLDALETRALPQRKRGAHMRALSLMMSDTGNPIKENKNRHETGMLGQNWLRRA